MFNLKRLYAGGIIIVLIIYQILYLKHALPYYAFTILLVLLAPSASIYPNKFSYILACLAWIFLYPVYYFIYRLDPVNAFFPILVFNILQAGFIMYKGLTAENRKRWETELKEYENHRDRLSAELKNLKSTENELKEKEFVIVNLYEITKQMSEDLKFEDIFTAFSAFIKENFAFLRCGLLILNWDDNTPRLDREYSVWRNGQKNASGKFFDHDKLIELTLKSPKELYLSRIGDDETFKMLRIDEKAETLVSVPLLSEKKMVGILVVEGLPKDELEKFVILSTQFALEIKKVLLYETVEKLAITDSLTGLYVRRYFSERLEEELNRSKRYKFKFAFLMIDIDDFKRCNDTYGHLVGDVVLKDASRIIKESLRAIDIICRYGGEEFAVILPETTQNGALVVAERLRKKIEENVFTAYDEKLKFTISAGISVYPRDATDEKGLIGKADVALYEAKRSGKNVVSLYKK